MYRIIALATPPTVKDQWLTSEILSMFHFHTLQPMLVEEKAKLLHQLFPATNATGISCQSLMWELTFIQVLKSLLSFDAQVYKMNSQSKADSQKHPALELSLRQLIRMTRHVAQYPADM
jgi:hypothetical protein